MEIKASFQRNAPVTYFIFAEWNGATPGLSLWFLVMQSGAPGGVSVLSSASHEPGPRGAQKQPSGEKLKAFPLRSREDKDSV